MKVGRDDVQAGILGNYSNFAQDRLTVSRSKSSVDYERCPASDHDPNVWNRANIPVRNHVNMRGNLDRHVFADQWQRRLWRLLEQ
jgi:hypothetical protein